MAPPFLQLIVDKHTWVKNNLESKTKETNSFLKSLCMQVHKTAVFSNVVALLCGCTYLAVTLDIYPQMFQK